LTPISYRGALLSTLLHATVYGFTQFAEYTGTDCKYICITKKKKEVEVNLRPTVSLLEIFFRQLRVCYFVAPSLTRGRVSNLLYNCFWTLPEQSLLGRSPAELTVHILLSHLRLLQPGGPGPRIYIPQEKGGPVIPPGTGLKRRGKGGFSDGV
jgi:hypothetical protein